MTGKEAREYLSLKQPKDLYPKPDRMERLTSALCFPQKKLRFVHIAGTNGKGSTACLTERVLREAGYRVGLFTSPHLIDFSERMRVNGRMIPDDDLARLAERVKEAAEGENIETAAFDRTTAAAFLWFCEQECDIVVSEVGLGGALDATNVIDFSEVSVITSIGLDHTAVLGPTVEEIASQKAGIIKKNGRVVYFPQGDGADDVIKRECFLKNARLFPAENSFKVISRERSRTRLSHPDLGEVSLGLPGEYQLKNASTAYEAVKVLRERGFAISDDDIRRGFALAHWPARFEALSEDPLILLDGGHNPQCAEGLTGNLRLAYPGRKFTFLIGMLADKDVKKVLSIIAPFAKNAVAVEVNDSRSLSLRELCAMLEEEGIPAFGCEDYDAAVKKAVEISGGEGICAFGSLYFTGDVRKAVDKLLNE